MPLAGRSSGHQKLSQLCPRDARPRPAGHGSRIDAQVDQVDRLFARVQQQFRLACMRGAGRVVLNKDVGRAAQVGVLDLERHLMRGQVDLAAPLNHLEFHHDEQPMRERQQAVGDAQVNP